MKNAIPHIAIGDVLSKSDEWINLDPAQTYQQVTIKMWGQGVVQRDEVSGAEIAASRRLRVRAGQFILSRIDARNGALGIIPTTLHGAVVSNDFPAFNLDTSRIMPEYLGWMSKTHSFVELCKAASEGTTNRVRLQEDLFLTLQIPLPPLDEQRRILVRIEELAAKIEEARGLRREAMDEAVVLPFATMRQIFTNNSACQVTRLEDTCIAIIDNLHSNPTYADEGTPCIRSSDVGWGELFLDTARRTSEDEYQRRTVRGEPTTNDIVLVREGGGTGKAAIVEEGHRFSLGQRVMMLRPDQSKVLPRFFLYQVLSPTIYEDHILRLTKGSASPHLNISTLRQFPFVLPSLDEQRHIVAYLDSLQAKVNTLKALQAETQAELDALLPSVLDKAFKGEL